MGILEPDMLLDVLWIGDWVEVARKKLDALFVQGRHMINNDVHELRHSCATLIQHSVASVFLCLPLRQDARTATKSHTHRLYIRDKHA